MTRTLTTLYNDHYLTRSFHLRNINKRRMEAVIKTLIELPEETYQSLSPKNTKRLLYFHLPNKDVLGSIKALPEGETVVLYLSPTLEDLPIRNVVYVVLHELSHLRLGHLNEHSLDKTYHEEDATMLARLWMQVANG